MALTSSIIEFAHASESLDALVDRVLGVTSGAVEPVLLANPGLADIAEALPIGTPVTIPVIAQAPAKATTFNLWD